jgi:hypothetical protein
MGQDNITEVFAKVNRSTFARLWHVLYQFDIAEVICAAHTELHQL